MKHITEEDSMYFTEEHYVFRQTFKDFLAKEVTPNISDWEAKGKIAKQIWLKMGQMGYFGINYSEVYGGLNLDFFYTLIFLEELQKINSGGFAAAMWAHTYLAMTHLNAQASEAIKQKYLTASIQGKMIGCLAITEPFAGSDVAAMRTTAARKGNAYIINGSKTFITNGVYADYIVLAAKTLPKLGNQGISIFLVDANSKGVSATKLDKLGWRASDTAELAFDNVEVPKTHLLGLENKGFQYIVRHFALERLIMGINAHARAEYALSYAINYTKERTAFGKSLDKFQAIRHSIAEMAAEINMVKTFNYSVAQKINKQQYPVKEATISKLLATKIADQVIYKCLQLLGGYGYMEEYPMARLYRDSRLGPIGGGTSEILRDIIAKIVIDGKNYKLPE